MNKSHNNCQIIMSSLHTNRDIIHCNSKGCCIPLTLDVDPYDHSYNATTVVAKSMLDRLAKRATLLSNNVLTVATDLVSYFHEPKKPSWDMRTTLLCSLLQALTSHGQLGELQIVRFFTSIPTMPPPFSCNIHEMTFIAKYRGLPGILKELDEAEHNTREIQAEWIVDKSIGPMDRILHPVIRSHIVDVVEDSSPRVILYAHGGAMVLMSTKTHRHLTHNISKHTGLPVFCEYLFYHAYIWEKRSIILLKHVPNRSSG